MSTRTNRRSFLSLIKCFLFRSWYVRLRRCPAITVRSEISTVELRCGLFFATPCGFSCCATAYTYTQVDSSTQQY
uniref:Uncharacterized protein n=1 Tax=Setaria italica TaxID=4555 RepID=K3ZFY6_SETIT